MQPAIVIAIYSILVVLSSLLGGFLPAMIKLTHTRIQLLMSGVGGLMLGIGLFHLLPHSIQTGISVERAIWWLMMGLLTTFLLIRVFSSHEHAPSDTKQKAAAENQAIHDDHVHHHHHAEQESRLVGGSKYRWIGLALGLSLHTLLDGVALAAAVIGDSHHLPGAIFLGFAVFLGVLLHKPLDSLSITAMMAASGWSVRLQAVVNIGYAIMCPLGALVFYLGVHDSPHESVLIGCALAFAAGIFICISLGDLLPELQFHAHDRLKLTVMLLLGVALAHGLQYLEPSHLHDSSSESSDQHINDHDHAY